jgi:hypothetical protein
MARGVSLSPEEEVNDAFRIHSKSLKKSGI